jgi:hypothetical protein
VSGMDTNCKRLIMLLLLFNFIVLPPSTYADVETNGFLLIKVDRYPYRYKDGQANGPVIRQSFKVPLTAEFMSQFKNSPAQNSMGTGFYCGGGNLKTDEGSTGFTWWIHRTADNRWSINMWGAGSETVEGVKLDSPYPTASQYMKIKELQDLDMGYQLSFAARSGGSGMNVSFEVKYVSAQDAKTLEAIPVAPVQKTDRSMLFKGDDQRELPLAISCGFQEG